jgi:hypothetical protein
VQVSPSSHAALLAANTQPVNGLQLSVVQVLLSLQTVAAPGRQAVSLQASPAVQAEPSSQAPSEAFCTQPFSASQIAS